MDLKRKDNHIDINHLQSINKPTIIKTSKNWVLPPRPRPGRKPNSTSPQPKQPQVKKKQQQQQQQQNVSNQSIPIQKQSTIKKQDNIENTLQKIKDENQFLKIELSKLVSDLKNLQQLKQDNEKQELHKKRNISEIEEELHSYKSIAMMDESDDDNSSQISTPSLMSNASSSMYSSLSSIQEEQQQQTLKLEDFLNVSFFENSTNNNISIKSEKDSELLELPKIEPNSNQIEFQFLKNQQQHQQHDTKIFKDENNIDSFFQIATHDVEELIEW